MHHPPAKPSRSWGLQRRGLRRLIALTALATVAVVSAVGSATASAPLRVCPTCTYTDIPAALAAAASQSGDDRIHVAAGNYPDTITVSTDVTIMAAGAEQTTIGEVNVEAGVSATIHGVTIIGHFSGGNPNLDRTLNNQGTLTLKHAVVTGGVFGPGIFNTSTGVVTLQGVVATRNTNGGIVNEGVMTLKSSSVHQNSAFLSGGGITNSGTMTLQDSAVNDNGARVLGGGVVNRGTMTLRDSTVSGNLAAELEGGGIVNGGVLILANSTVAGNQMLIGNGGGIANRGTLILRDSAVRGNRANANFQANQRGGGIYNAATGDAELRSSAVVDNLAPIGPGIFNDGGTLTVKDSTVQP